MALVLKRNFICSQQSVSRSSLINQDDLSLKMAFNSGNDISLKGFTFSRFLHDVYRLITASLSFGVSESIGKQVSL